MNKELTREDVHEIAYQGSFNELERELARMLLAAQAHITELEMAPPAPVGPYEEPVPVMPDFPGRVMTQRECWQAGKAFGLAEGRKSSAVTDGWVMVPKEPTAEMQTSGGIAVKFDTSAINKLWTANKVYEAMLAAAPQQEVKGE